MDDQSLKVTDRNHTKDWSDLALETVLLWRQLVNSRARFIIFCLATDKAGSCFKEQEWLVLFGVESTSRGLHEGAGAEAVELR